MSGHPGLPPEDRNNLGRPSLYTPELGLEICTRLAEGESLRSICEDPKMPNRGTVLRWVLDGLHEEFAGQYEKARNIQAESFADDMQDIADDGRNDYMLKETESGAFVQLNSEAIQRSRLRVDTRKWIASRILPKKYGDKIENTHVGDANRPIAVAEIAHKW